ncbi:MAG: transaldolase, partial [Gemmatimonadales bacterium]
MADLFAPLPEALRAAVRSRAESWHRMEGTRRLWARDATLWTAGDESKWLGWLDVIRAKPMSVRLDEKVQHVLVLGMGGSSLCPYVLASTFGRIKGQPQLHVLDSTDPAQIRAAESQVDPAHSLFVVASKSGSTLEPNILRDYFLSRVGDARRFVAITDPGSQLEKQATADGFRAIVHGVPSIGGRFSALSAFGMVPAALMGIDVAKLLGRAAAMADACGPASGPEEKNPGVALGIIMGEAALHGMDKLTILAANAVSQLGAWLEQLVAESTGKRGKAIIPVDGEAVRPPDAYGSDRLFVSLSVKGEDDTAHEAAASALQ